MQSLATKDSLEDNTATHSSILAWRIPWTEEPSRLQSIGSQTEVTEHAHIWNRIAIRNHGDWEIKYGIDRFSYILNLMNKHY